MECRLPIDVMTADDAFSFPACCPASETAGLLLSDEKQSTVARLVE